MVPNSPNQCDALPAELASKFCLLTPQGGVCAGLWHLGATSLALIGIREADGRVEWRQLEFDPALVPRDAAVCFVLRSATEGGAVWESEGPTGHPRIDRMRMEFARTSGDTLLLRFLVPDGADGWVAVREEPHRRVGG